MAQNEIDPPLAAFYDSRRLYDAAAKRLAAAESNLADANKTVLAAKEAKARLWVEFETNIGNVVKAFQEYEVPE